MPGGRGLRDTRVPEAFSPRASPYRGRRAPIQSDQEGPTEDMFYLRYLAAELRRRKGRTVLTALGLAVGVGLVVTVTALSEGLDDAQGEVLEPLTGVGTDLSVNRPVTVEEQDGEEGFAVGPGAGLSAKEQRQLEKENGTARVGLENLGEPGERFEQENLVTTELSFPERKADQISGLDGVEQVGGGLTLNQMQVSGRVPEGRGTESPVLRP